MGFVLDTLMSLFIFFCYEERKKCVRYSGKALGSSVYTESARGCSPRRLSTYSEEPKDLLYIEIATFFPSDVRGELSGTRSPSAGSLKVS